VRINPGLSDAGWHDLAESAAYEWWYLDALADDGRTAFVFIWFAGLPFSPDALTDHERGRGARALDHVAMFTAVYLDGRPIAYALNRHPEAELTASRTALSVRIGPNSLIQMENGYLVTEVDVPLLSGGSRLTGSLVVRPGGGEPLRAAGDPDAQHVWNPLFPACRVSGPLCVRSQDGSVVWRADFEGAGYLDHNYGRAPLTEGIDRWHWGRAHIGDTTFVFYRSEAAPVRGGPRARDTSVLAIVDGTDAASMCTEVGFEATAWSRRILCPRFPVELRITGRSDAGDARLDVVRRHILDWGPFYMRFLCDVTATVGNRAQSGVAVTEYLDPRGLRARWLRPLIKTRIRRVTSP